MPLVSSDAPSSLVTEPRRPCSRQRGRAVVWLAYTPPVPFGIIKMLTLVTLAFPQTIHDRARIHSRSSRPFVGRRGSCPTRKGQIMHRVLGTLQPG